MPLHSVIFLSKTGLVFTVHNYIWMSFKQTFRYKNTNQPSEMINNKHCEIIIKMKRCYFRFDDNNEAACCNLAPCSISNDDDTNNFRVVEFT